ncbi:3191_t:CDS:2 [Entrophospora sp. SA101]|nr:3191_t:CDS:2 [Entrophospora sp. SA101]
MDVLAICVEFVIGLEEDQSSPFSDFTEELPVIKEKIVQAADSNH